MRRVLGLLLVLSLVGGGLAWRYDWVPDWVPDWVDPARDEESPTADPVTEPAEVPPPPGLDLPEVTSPEALARPADEGELDPRRVRRALAPLLDDPLLGPRVLAVVAPLEPGPPVFTAGADRGVPASLTKLVTGAAALLALGPDHRFATRAVLEGRRLTLVGGGDPYLELEPWAPTPDDTSPPFPPRADLETLAAETARALRAQGTRRVRLTYDTSLFSGPEASPSWEPDYLPDDIVSPISPLWVDQGRVPLSFERVPDPALVAAGAFAGALAREGVKVDGIAQEREADPAARLMAEVEGAPLDVVVERVLEVSDNEASEVLLRHVGLATTADGSFGGGRRGVVRLLEEAGVDLGDSVLHDGSGLSRANVLEPGVLVELLRLAADPARPELRPVLTGLPVAGFTGSLALRFDTGDDRARGRVRAKTGTLTGVTSLAGIALGRDGTPMVFVLMADRVARADKLTAPDALDRAAAALGACACGR